MRRIMFCAVALIVALLPGSPSEAAPPLEGYATGTDTTGDATPAVNDIKELTVIWNFDEMHVQVRVDATVPALSDSSWEKPSADRDGRSLLVEMRVNDSAEDNQSYLVVNADGGAIYTPAPSLPGESEDPDVKVCEAEVDVSGDAINSHIPPSCLNHPGKLSLIASLYASSTDEGDTAIANGAADPTAVSGSVAGGYWLGAADGGVFAFGNARSFGSMGGKPLNKPVVGMSATSTWNGYRLVASDGGVFSFGDAQFHGSMGGKALNKPMVGVASNFAGSGYWTVASDGGVFAFGDAQFFGSMGGKPLNSPIVAIAATQSGNGYWLFAADGGVFAYGDAQFFGSMGGLSIVDSISGAAITPTGNGYRMVARDGGVFSFGDATFEGSVAQSDAADYPIKAVTSLRDGYLLADHEGRVVRFGKTFHFGDLISAVVPTNAEIVSLAPMNDHP